MTTASNSFQETLWTKINIKKWKDLQNSR